MYAIRKYDYFLCALLGRFDLGRTHVKRTTQLKSRFRKAVKNTKPVDTSLNKSASLQCARSLQKTDNPDQPAPFSAVLADQLGFSEGVPVPPQQSLPKSTSLKSARSQQKDAEECGSGLRSSSAPLPLASAIACASATLPSSSDSTQLLSARELTNLRPSSASASLLLDSPAQVSCLVDYICAYE